MADHEISGQQPLVVRKIGDTHRTSTFAQLKWAIQKLGVSDYWRATTSPLELTYIPTGQKVLFRGFDDPLKLASTTVSTGSLCWVWVEEAYEIDSEDAFDLLDLSVPRGNVEPPLFKQTTLTFNPWSERHWLKKRFFDTPADNVVCYSTDYRCNEFWMRLTWQSMRGCAGKTHGNTPWRGLKLGCGGRAGL